MRQDDKETPRADVQALTEALRDAVAALGGIRSDNVPESVRAALSSLALQPVEPPPCENCGSKDDIRTCPVMTGVPFNAPPDAQRYVCSACVTAWHDGDGSALEARRAAAPLAAVPAQPAEPPTDCMNAYAETLKYVGAWSSPEQIWRKAWHYAWEAHDEHAAANAAQPAEAPFGALYANDSGNYRFVYAADFDKPMARLDRELADADPTEHKWTLLYAAQPADRAEPDPLTDAQIDAAAERADWPKSMLAPVIRAKLRDFASAILAAGKP